MHRLVATLSAALCLSWHVSAGAQPLPSPFELPKPPALPNEANPNGWPQPDYLSLALDMTELRPSSRAASLARGLSTDASYLVLPVQGQAFGFSPSFRAIIGAHLDRQLELAGVRATHQTDLADAYGPFVRRLADAQIDEAIKGHPDQKLVLLYLGHDGIDQAFVTLVVRDARGRSQAHRMARLPEDAAAGADAIAKLLPALLQASGIGLAPSSAAPAAPAPCGEESWTFAVPPSALTPLQRACHALVMGTLLPAYERNSPLLTSETISSAKLAWLAQAYVYASSPQIAPESAAAIRELAASQLPLNQTAGTSPGLLGLRRLSDPVVSRLARLLATETALATSPSNSTRDLRGREVDGIVQGLPAFAAALVRARADQPDGFMRVDFCALEDAYPAALLRRTCPDAAAQGPSQRGTRIASGDEALLYQEWRLASYHSELRYYGATQGNRVRTEEVVRLLPADVAQHPYIQRLRYELVDRRGGGSFDDQIAREREAARRSVQSTVDLQRYDHWLAGYSLTDHISGNLNIRNDEQVRTIEEAELRLVEVLRFDRYNGMGSMGMANRRRNASEGAFFLLKSPMQVRMLAMMSGMPSPPPGAASAPPAQPYVARLFAPRSEFTEDPPLPTLEAAVSSNPMSMDARVRLAVAQLKHGGRVDDAVRLINERAPDARSDYQVGESHAWAGPAHAFYFSGEPTTARRYYERVTKIGTGSDSDMLARVRLPLIDGRLQAAVDATRARIERYDSDYARRDLIGMLFMLNRSSEAWKVFLPRAATSEAFQLWLGAYTGHRQAGAKLSDIDTWLLQQGVEGTQIDFQDVSRLYLHLHAVMDRVPSDADISLLEKPRGKERYVSQHWAASARLIRSATTGTQMQQSYAAARSALKDRGASASDLFLLPAYTWVAWHASAGKDDALDDVRAATLGSGFEHLLAKSMLLALEGTTDESLRYLTAARYDLATLSEGRRVNAAIPPPYQFALAALWMYQKSGNAAYREQLLHFVQAYQRVHPFLGWLYSMEAWAETRPKERLTAACRARFLDPQSHFLTLAKVDSLSPSACASSLWR